MTHFEKFDMSQNEAEDNKNGLLRNEHPHSDDTFDLSNIPLEKLDSLWLPLDGFNLGLPHRHALRLVGKSACKGDAAKAQKVITSTYHIASSLFVIKEGNKGMCAAILMSENTDNINVVVDAMQKLGFCRVIPTDDQLLEDSKQRRYIHLRFEPAPTTE